MPGCPPRHVCVAERRLLLTYLRTPRCDHGHPHLGSRSSLTPIASRSSLRSFQCQPVQGTAAFTPMMSHCCYLAILASNTPTETLLEYNLSTPFTIEKRLKRGCLRGGTTRASFVDRTPAPNPPRCILPVKSSQVKRCPNRKEDAGRAGSPGLTQDTGYFIIRHS